jgi:hypothetical protein
MKPLIQIKTTIPSLLVSVLLVCFGLLPRAQAVGPDTDGTIPGSNNGEGIGVLVSRTTGVWNTGTGFEALNHLTAGNQNTATGLRALFSDINGGFNTATGVFSLFSNTSGFFNNAIGAYALANNISGNYNTANGYGALYRNTASNNTATGFGVLHGNTTGSRNTASGYLALNHNTTANFNGAFGASALFSNVDGFSNNAFGDSALFENIHASGNTAVGDIALANNDSTGNGVANANTAVGAGALFSNTDGDSNNAVGFNALGSNTDGLFNNVMGFNAMADNVSGAGNVAIGDSAGAGVEGDFNIYVGAFAGPAPSPAPVNESETIRIGDVFNVACYVGGISGQTASGGVAVFIDGNGKLGTLTSSAQFKDNIKPMDKASESVLALKPVTFRYKKEIDANRIPQFGLVAEDVAKVNPDLVVNGRDGKPYTVRYEAVNAMLLNEFLKEHWAFLKEQRKVEAQEATITQLKQDFQSKLVEQQKQIKALTTGLQKVSAQLAAASPSRGGLEVDKSAPQMVSSSR